MVGKPGCEQPSVSENGTSWKDFDGGALSPLGTKAGTKSWNQELGPNCNLGLLTMLFGNQYVWGQLFPLPFLLMPSVCLTSSASLAWGAFAQHSCLEKRRRAGCAPLSPGGINPQKGLSGLYPQDTTPLLEAYLGIQVSWFQTRGQRRGLRWSY